MKGLLLKDFLIIKNQLKNFIFIAFIGIVFMFTYDDVTFGIGYITFIFSLMTISTISYDDLDNGAAYLFTLPINEKTYAWGKYALGLIFSVISWGITVIIGLIITLVRSGDMFSEEMIISLIAIFLAVQLLLALTIPIQIKFGNERGRIAMMVVMGAIFAAVYVYTKLTDKLNINYNDILGFLNNQSAVFIVIILVIICAVLICISEKITEKILEKREY